jgi:hypothetical protein
MSDYQCGMGPRGKCLPALPHVPRNAGGGSVDLVVVGAVGEGA